MEGFTLKIIITGLVGLVPINDWESMQVLLVNAMEPTIIEGKAIPAHIPMLRFSPDNLPDECGEKNPPEWCPDVWATYTDPSSGKQSHVWLIADSSIVVDDSSKSTRAGYLRRALCSEAPDNYKPSRLNVDCRSTDGGRHDATRRNDFRRVLSMKSISAKFAKVKKSCLSTPVGKQCRDHLAARLTIDGGDVQTSRISSKGDQALYWDLSRKRKKPVVSRINFAGGVEVFINVQGSEVVLQRAALTVHGEYQDALKLVPRDADDGMVTIYVENIPVEDLFRVIDEDRIIADLAHFAHIYRLAEITPRLKKRPVPRVPHGAGVSIARPPKCEPPLLFAKEMITP